jgi:hypothetical protein
MPSVRTYGMADDTDYRRMTGASPNSGGPGAARASTSRNYVSIALAFLGVSIERI